MSIAAITAGSSQLCALQNQYQQVRSQFKQLGQDLQGGNLASAQSDFVTLSQAAASQLGGSSAVAQALSIIGQSLQSGDSSGAEPTSPPSATVGPCAVPQHSHVPPVAGKVDQGLEQLGQAVQSGDLSESQQALATAQQLWQPSPSTVQTWSNMSPLSTLAPSISA
jgi:hypothetical protein